MPAMMPIQCRSLPRIAEFKTTRLKRSSQNRCEWCQSNWKCQCRIERALWQSKSIRIIYTRSVSIWICINKWNLYYKGLISLSALFRVRVALYVFAFAWRFVFGQKHNETTNTSHDVCMIASYGVDSIQWRRIIDKLPQISTYCM